MADLVLTAASVVPSGSAVLEDGVAGATLVAGKLIYKEAATGKWKLADADSVTAEVKGANGVGMALNGASDGQPMRVLRPGGDVDLGSAVLTAGSPYYLSDGAGGIRLTPDTGDYVVCVGFARTTQILMFMNIIPGVTL